MSRTAFTVGRAEANQTLAASVRRRLNIPWSRANRAVTDGRVRVNGSKCTEIARRLRPGDRVEISDDHTTPKHRPTSHRPPAPRFRLPDGVEPPRIVYADDALVVADKPAGLTTMRHAEEAAEFGERGKRFLPATLMDLLPGLMGEPGCRLRAVHRIDRDTSGVVVFARTAPADRHLSGQFRTHTVQRRYLALTRGVPTSPRIESRLVRDRGDGRRGSTSEAKGGQRAVTHVRVVEELAGFALVECRLETGRTHQIRIHLGEHGTPLCGETVYDRPIHGRPLPDGSGATRTMLHAAELGFTHPETGESMCWEAEPPGDFQSVREAISRVR